MTFKKQSVVFYVLLVLCAAGIVLWFSDIFQDWLILFGEMLIGRPLVRDAWYTRFSSVSLSVALFFLTVPLYFFKFDGYFVKEETPSDRKLWEMSFTEHIRSYAAFVRGHLWLFALTVFVLLAAYGPKLFNGGNVHRPCQSVCGFGAVLRDFVQEISARCAFRARALISGRHLSSIRALVLRGASAVLRALCRGG